MKAYRAIDLAGRPVLAIGHGPSSAGLTAAQVVAIKSAVPDLFVIGVNRGWQVWPLDLVLTVDHRQAWEFLRTKVYLQVPVAFPQRMLQQWVLGREGGVDGLEDGTNWYSIAPLPGGTSSGCAAFHAALLCGADRVALIGFDGSRDPTSRFHGTDGYRRSTPPAACCAGWEEHMRKIARLERDTNGRDFRVLLCLPDLDPHPLDELPSERVLIGEDHPEEDIARCLSSRSERSCSTRTP